MKLPAKQALVAALIFISLWSLPIRAEGPSPADGSCPSTFLKPHQKLITILSTNDIHGGVEPTHLKDGKSVGGLLFWGGVVQSIRTGIQNQFGNCGGALVMDAGDQFQGTLMSNFNEGDLVFKAFNEIGYDAIVPGNHDYDFGPIGWLEDKVTPQSVDQNPRGVIEKLSRQANFPLLSANTYLKASLLDFDGKAVKAESVGCKSASLIDWSKAISPAFLKPYLIKEVAGVRVALIGIDNPATTTTTTVENVTDLCFRDPLETYVQVRESLENFADVFVLVMHDGDAGNEFHLTDLLKKLTAVSPHSVDAVVAGHTHFINDVNVAGVPGIQSGSGGERFGRIDLIYDADSRSVLHDPAKVYAGVRLDHQACDKKVDSFCALVPELDNPSEAFDVDSPRVTYEQVQVSESPTLEALIGKTRGQLDLVAKRVLGVAAKRLTRDRILESPISDAMTDGLRALSGAEIAFLNTGGLRDDIPAGVVTYEALFQVVPFANRAVLLQAMPASLLIGLLQKSIQTCGSYGALLQSGLKVSFTRNCGTGSIDTHAQLVTVETLSGEIIFDSTQAPALVATRTFDVATLDFLAAGGSGYSLFATLPVKKDLGIFREVLTDELLKHPASWSGEMDGRWTQLPQSTPQGVRAGQ
ncbi:MAG: bifunctional metallophosphatase/5'-nucleotidase [Methylotenera sp.]|nr:bifunctional metallophosphatase/5'-nucleotidase [Oligoflexia bacterium]